MEYVKIPIIGTIDSKTGKIIFNNKKMETKEFPQGIFIKAPSENAPDFVIGKITIKKSEALSWIDGKGDWINIDIKKSKEGNMYLEVNNWVPKQ